MRNQNERALDQVSNPAVITLNNFKFKSLSNWSYNIAHGCLHGCSFCYVPATPAIWAEERLERTGVIPEKWKKERSRGQHWGDLHWGEYSLLRSWDEAKFRKSLAAAENAKKVAPDSNRAIMFCTTTDPYQTFSIPGNLEKTACLKKTVGENGFG